MKTLAQIRKEYPDYADMSDFDLANALHSKYYSDMPKNEFMSKVGVDMPKSGGIMENAQAFAKGATMGLLPKAQALGIAALDQFQNPHLPWSQSYSDAVEAAGQLTEGASPLAEIAGAVVSPIGNKALALGKGANLAQTAVRTGVGGGVLGAAYGDEVMKGDWTGVAQNAGMGLLGGAAVPVAGAGLSKAGGAAKNAIVGRAKNAIVGRLPQTLTDDALATADQFNVPLTLDQVAGGTVLPATGKLSSQAPVTGAPLRNAYNRTNESIVGAIDDVASRGVASRIGRDKNTAGNILVSGYNTGVKSTKDAFGAKYNRVYDMVAKDTQLVPNEVTGVADEILTSLGNKEIATADGFGRVWDKAQAVTQPRTLEQSRRLASELADMANGNKGNEIGNFAERLRASLRNDIDATVSAVSPEAGELLQRTNRQYAKFKELETAAQRIVGSNNKKTVEQAVNSFMSKINQNSLDEKAFNAMRRFVPKEEWGQFADYAAHALGEVNGEFSAQVFARNASKLGDNAIEGLFKAPNQAKDLRNLVKLVNEIKPQVVNPSGTAASVSELTAVGLAATFNPALLLAPAGNLAISSVLANPKLAKGYVRLIHSLKNGRDTTPAINALIKSGEDPNVLSQFIGRGASRSPMVIEVTPQDRLRGSM